MMEKIKQWIADWLFGRTVPAISDRRIILTIHQVMQLAKLNILERIE